MNLLEEINVTCWQEPILKTTQNQAVKNLEAGKVLYVPALPFDLLPEERKFLSPVYVDPKRKNISYDLQNDQLGGTVAVGDERNCLQAMLKRYALASSHFLRHLIPHYANTLSVAKTSFRPTEIFGRQSSVRKDDTRLHIDAFPSNPTKGRRILRMFTNINPEGKSRVWKVGEPFEEVVKKFACQIRRPIPAGALLLQLLKITKTQRSAYDHYMLHMHNRMKEDTTYQSSVAQEEVLFPPGSSWIVFTDQVSHAALSGQHVLEQTFSLPAEGMKENSSSPLKILEKFLSRKLTN